MKFFTRKLMILVLLFGFYTVCAGNNASDQIEANNPELTNVYNLAKRVIEGKADNFIFKLEKKTGANDFFEISTFNKKILIKGNNGVSLASGLNWYLKKYVNSQFSIIDKQISFPKNLPLPTSPERVNTEFNYRYFLNICTFSYTMAWWDWKEWERQIDWMAMNGINFPLAITGQEAVWTEVYKELGLSQKQIDKFLVGPAYLPWSWMGNIDSLGGPLPKSWIEKHKLLEQKILQRERGLGMKPILQAFTGHVPESIKEIYPKAKLHRTGNWSAGFGGTIFLDPSDELFNRIGKLFIKKQTEMYGTDHYYSADCFNEVNPDSNDPVFLSNMSKNVYKSMADADPKAVWVMQAWFLYYSIDNFWKEPQVKAFLGAVPDDKMMILDLYGEEHPVWKKQKAFYGKPWIWNVLHNYGGRTSMSGKLQAISDNFKDAITSPQKGNLSGIGMAMEYFGNNPVIEEIVMSKVWEKEIPETKEWLFKYIENRYGKKNEFAMKAWEGMLKTVYNSGKQTGTYLCERPGFYNPKLTYRTSPIPDYDPKILATSLDNLLNCSNDFKDLDTYQFDVVNLTRQVISPLAYYWILDLEKAYQKKDMTAFLKTKTQFINLIKDFDVLLSTKKEYLLGNWIESAKRWGVTKEEKNLYEFNARNIITLWGEKCTEGQFDDLNTYAYKQWAGMFTDYHLVRWTKFFDEVENSMKKGENWNRESFLASSCTWEKNWSHSNNTFSVIPKGDPIKISKEIFNKYLPFITSHSK